MSEQSLLREALKWKIKSTLTCGHCRQPTVREDDIIDVSLGLAGDSVESCFAEYLGPEELGEGNEWVCEKCKHAHPRTVKQLQL
jgi:ubiquitin C-terminal hydrolase